MHSPNVDLFRLSLQANAIVMTNPRTVKETRGRHKRYREVVPENTSQQNVFKSQNGDVSGLAQAQTLFLEANASTVEVR
jgi:hypothetical protein